MAASPSQACGSCAPGHGGRRGSTARGRGVARAWWCRRATIAVDCVELAELDAVRVELVVLELDARPAAPPAWPRPRGGVRLALLDLRPHLLLGLGVGQPEHLEELDRTRGSTCWRASRSAWRPGRAPASRCRAAPCPAWSPRTARASRRGCRSPGLEVFEPRPFDGGCRWIASPAQKTRCRWRWVAYISLLPHSDVPVIFTSRSGTPTRFRTISGRRFLVDVRRRLADVVAPDDEPLVPRPDHADQAGADAADVRAGLDDPVEDGGAVATYCEDVGLEGDVHRAGDVHLALERQPDVLGDQGLGAVRADQVLRPDRRRRGR